MKRRLVNVQTQQPIVEFEGEQTLIHNKFLKLEMQELGIPIPHGLRGVYHGKECVRLEDSEFQKAFQEIYYLTSMNPQTFRWD